MLAEHGYTIATGLAQGCNAAAVRVRSPQVETLSVSSRVDSKHSDLSHERDWHKKSSLQGHGHFRIYGQFIKSLSAALSPAQ